MRRFLFLLSLLALFSISFCVGCQPEQNAQQAAKPEPVIPEVTVAEPEVVVAAPAEKTGCAKVKECKSDVTAAADKAEPAKECKVDVNTCTKKDQKPEQCSLQCPAMPVEPKAAPSVEEQAKPVEVTKESPAEQPVDKVVVTINGKDISQSVVDELVAPQIQQIAAQNSQVPPAFFEQYKKQLEQKAIENIVIEELLSGQIKELNLVVSDEDVDQQLEEMLAEQNLSRTDFEALIAAQGATVEQVKENLKKSLPFQNLLEMQFDGKVDVTIDDANDYYVKNASQFQVPEQVRASHILITPDLSDPNTDPNQAQAQALEKAMELLAEVKKPDADFAQLAKENSKCPSAASGGDLNFFARGQMVPEFDEAAFALDPNQISDVVETKFGYHIIKVTDKNEASTKTFDEVSEDIVAMLENQKKQQIAKDYFESLKAQATIVYPQKPEQPTDVPAETQQQ